MKGNLAEINPVHDVYEYGWVRQKIKGIAHPDVLVTGALFFVLIAGFDLGCPDPWATGELRGAIISFRVEVPAYD